METFLIIDGNNLLFQMFYGMPSKIYNKRGQTIHATIGFISFVLKQVKLFKASRIAVVFDYDGSIERQEIYNDYKANRINNWDELPMDEVPFNEEENIIKCLDYLGIKSIYSKNMEADDLIASLTKLFDKENKVIISSFDSDFFQLINENVCVLRYRGKNSLLFNEEKFKEKFGFPPDRYVFYKSIVGDSSDNIKGVPTIGRIRGSMICKECSDLKEINNSTLSLKIKDIILSNRDIIKRNDLIIRLKYIDSVKYDLDFFKFDNERIKKTNSEILSSCEVFN